MRDRSKRRVGIYILLVIGFMSIAYAALSINLNIRGDVILSTKGSWNIYFDNLSTPILKGKAEVGDTKMTATNFTFDVSLELPSDSITYTFDVVNDGIIDALLSSVSLIGAEAASQNHLTYNFTYEDGTSLEMMKDKLPAKTRKRLKLTISYDDMTSLDVSEVTIKLGVALVYIQDTQNNSEVPSIENPNLALNGNLEYESNIFFPKFTYSNGELSFTHSTMVYLTSNHFIPIDPNKEYELSITMKTNNPEAKFYAGIVEYDVDKEPIYAYQIMYIPNTLTTLTEDLNDGDTVVHFSDLSSWNITETTPNSQRGFIFWNYVDSTGYQYPELTYSRNSWVGLFTYDNVDKENNTITLSNPWSNGTIKAGTKLSQSASEGYNYGFVPNKYLSTEYQTYTYRMNGVFNNGTVRPYTKFRPGTKYINLLILHNYNNSSNTTLYVKNFSVKEVN